MKILKSREEVSSPRKVLMRRDGSSMVLALLQHRLRKEIFLIDVSKWRSQEMLPLSAPGLVGDENPQRHIRFISYACTFNVHAFY
jgi:hypothetical protein